MGTLLIGCAAAIFVGLMFWGHRIGEGRSHRMRLMGRAHMKALREMRQGKRHTPWDRDAFNRGYDERFDEYGRPKPGFDGAGRALMMPLAPALAADTRLVSAQTGVSNSPTAGAEALKRLRPPAVAPAQSPTPPPRKKGKEWVRDDSEPGKVVLRVGGVVKGYVQRQGLGWRWATDNDSGQAWSLREAQGAVEGS